MTNANRCVSESLWKVPGIYLISNVENGDGYVGSTSNLANRWSVHKYELRNNKHNNRKLQAAWVLHGEERFKFEVLCIVDSVNDLIPTEQLVMDKLKPAYNIAPRAGSCVGLKLSDERKKQISDRVKGSGNYWFGKIPPCAGMSKNPEVKAKISAKNSGEGNPMYGVTPPHAKLTDDQVREIRTGLLNGLSLSILASSYGVSKGAITHIRQGRSYRRVV